MPIEVILPKVDMDMSHGVLATWHVKEGDEVRRGQPLFDIETDKAAMEVEAPADGRICRLSAKAGDRLAVGTVVAWLYETGEPLESDPSAAGTVPQKPELAEEAKGSTRSQVQPVEVILPKVDMDMTHGTVSAWHRNEGDVVGKGAPLFDIETDKAAMEVEAPTSGRLAHVKAKAGDKIAVGAVIAYIYPEGADIPAQLETPAATSARQDEAAAPDTSIEKPVPASAAVGDIGTRTRATPAARKAARKADINLSQLRGTGPRSRVQRDDVSRFLEDRAKETAPATQAPAGWNRQSGTLSITSRAGRGIPILLIHGFASDSSSWLPLEKELGGRAFIRIDLPGHGSSPRRRFSAFGELARMTVEAFDEATRSHGQVHLLGHSLGAAVAAAIADIRGPRVASLIALAPAGLGPEIDADALSGIVRATRTESLAPWLRRLTAVPERISDDYAKAAMRQRRDPELRAYQADAADVLFPDGVQAFDLRSAFERLQMPTTLVWGRRDKIIPHRHAFAVHADFAIHFLSGIGHIPQFECPDRVAKIVARHLAAAEVQRAGV